MASGTSGIRVRAFRLLKNSLTLGFVLIFLDLIRPELSSLISFEVGGFSITGEMVLSIVSLLFIIYFGYFILIEAKYFLGLISIKLGGRERGKAKSVTYDVAIIISLVLASQLLAPFFASIPNFGDNIATTVNIAFLAVGFVIVYHLANEIYDLIKKNIENLIEEASKQIRREHQEKTGEAK
jgi:hypothetical protein